MKKRIVFLTALYLICLLAGCSNDGGTENRTESRAEDSTEERVAEQVLEQLEPFTSGNMGEINEYLFSGMQDLAQTDEYGLIPEMEPSGEGILAELMEESRIDVKEVTEDTVVLEITARDMRHVFSDYGDTLLTAQNPEEMAEMLLDYAEDADIVVMEVTLSYTMDENRVEFDYTDAALINGLTGGLMEAYQALYTQIFDAVGGMIE